MTWVDDQRAIRALLLAEAPADVDRLGGAPARWLVYRRMVRARFADVLAEGFERFRVAVGAEAFERLVDRFLAVRPPASPYLRDVPGEFLRFLEGGTALAGLPAFALDLARYECAELEAAHAPEQEGDVVAFDMQLEAVLSSSARVLELEHDLATALGEGAAPALPSPPACVYRDPKTHEVESLELTPMAARILRGIERAEGPLVDIVKTAANEARVAIDAAFVEALGTLLADLVERGVIVGSRAHGEPRIDSP